MIDRSYLGVDLPNDPQHQESEQPDPITDKRGGELAEHMLFFGATKDEFEELDYIQLKTLEMAGLLR